MNPKQNEGIWKMFIKDWSQRRSLNASEIETITTSAEREAENFLSDEDNYKYCVAFLLWKTEHLERELIIKTKLMHKLCADLLIFCGLLFICLFALAVVVGLVIVVKV